MCLILPSLKYKGHLTVFVFLPITFGWYQFYIGQGVVF